MAKAPSKTQDAFLHDILESARLIKVDKVSSIPNGSRETPTWLSQSFRLSPAAAWCSSVSRCSP